MTYEANPLDLFSLENLPYTEPTEMEFIPLVNGYYKAFVDNVEMKPTKSGTGLMAVIIWKVESEGYEGAKVWQNILMEHSSEVAVRIGHNMVNMIRKAMHIEGSTSFKDFLGQRADIKIVMEPGNDGKTRAKIVVVSEYGKHVAFSTSGDVIPPDHLPPSKKEFNDEIPF